jgi:hypothetical protein
MSTIKQQRSSLMKRLELTPSILSSLSLQNVSRCIDSILKTCKMGPFLVSYDEAAVNPKLEPFLDEGVIKLFGLASESLIHPLASVKNVRDMPNIGKDDLATSAFTVAIIPVTKSRERGALIPPQQVVCSIQCKSGTISNAQLSEFLDMFWQCVPPDYRHLAIGFVADNAASHRK